MGHAEARRQRALRIEVDEQDATPVLGQAGAEVDGRRGLADAALLVTHGDDLGRTVRRPGFGRWDVSRLTAGQSEFGSRAPVVGHTGPSLVRQRTGLADIRASLTGRACLVCQTRGQHSDHLPAPRAYARRHEPEAADTVPAMVGLALCGGHARTLQDRPDRRRPRAGVRGRSSKPTRAAATSTTCWRPSTSSRTRSRC